MVHVSIARTNNKKENTNPLMIRLKENIERIKEDLLHLDKKKLARIIRTLLQLTRSSISFGNDIHRNTAETHRHGGYL